MEKKLPSIFGWDPDQQQILEEGRRKLPKEFLARGRQIKEALKNFPARLGDLEVNRPYPVDHLVMDVFDLRMEEGLKGLLDRWTEWESAGDNIIFKKITVPPPAAETAEQTNEPPNIMPGEAGEQSPLAEKPEIKPQTPAKIRRPKKIVGSGIIQHLNPDLQSKINPAWDARGLRDFLELPGLYPNLNVYESSLLDSLRQNFGKAEFQIGQIKFPESKVRGHTYMFQHLAYLVDRGYLEVLPRGAVDYSYKLKW